MALFHATQATKGFESGDMTRKMAETSRGATVRNVPGTRSEARRSERSVTFVTLGFGRALPGFRLPSFPRSARGLSARTFIAGSSRPTSALGTELARPSALLAVAVLRTVRHVLRIGRDVRSILVGLLHRRRRSSNHGVTLE